MLKIYKNPSKHLMKKRWLISITNNCNLSCGGCAQLCGHFPPDKIWYLTMDQIDQSIKSLKQHTGPDNNWNECTIFGGEPTLHPQWNEVLELLYSHSPMKFRINTNGRLGHEPFSKFKNVTYYVDRHPAEQQFHPTWIASQDIMSLESDEAYWEVAQKKCKIWNREGAMIYRGKAYFCENAASMDWLFFNGNNGWEIEEGKCPFDKTNEEIADQAKKFCKHCSWCVSDLDKQKVGDKTMVSETNSCFFKKQLVQLVVPNKVKNDPTGKI